MDFQAMYENMQQEIKSNLEQIEGKRRSIATLDGEIAILQTNVYKIQGAMEMLAIVSKQLEEQEPKTIAPENKTEDNAIEVVKKESKKIIKK